MRSYSSLAARASPGTPRCAALSGRTSHANGTFRFIAFLQGCREPNARQPVPLLPFLL
jgi:hypothetical protein